MDLPDLSLFQYSIVYNAMSFTIATFLAAAIFFFIAPGVNRKYRPAMVVSGLVVAIAGYHYYRIAGSFEASYAYAAAQGIYSFTGKPFNDFYRYADWLLTVPLLMIELVAVMALPAAQSRRLLVKLVPATLLMIVLGFPGEVSNDIGTRWLWWVLSMLPFLYILYVLFAQLSDAMARQAPRARALLNLCRITVLVTWSFYPVAYALTTVFGSRTAEGQVALQLGYTISDVLAKAGFGLLIYYTAVVKSELDNAGTPANTSSSTTPEALPVTA